MSPIITEKNFDAIFSEWIVIELRKLEIDYSEFCRQSGIDLRTFRKLRNSNGLRKWKSKELFRVATFFHKEMSQVFIEVEYFARLKAISE